MKHAGAISLALLLGSMTTFAWSSGRKTSQPVVLQSGQPSLNCPVDMDAGQQIGMTRPQNVAPGVSRQFASPAQNLRLTLKNSTFQEIVAVRITAYGVNSKGQFSPAQLAADDSSAINRTVELKLTVDPKSQTSTDLRLPDFTSVSYISVDSIRYADGSAWHSSADRTCHVVPNGVMLITSR